jgi:RNA polymerase sigma factor (sigma-70 family)
MSAGSERQESFGELLAQVRAGDDDAACRLVETYGPHVIRAVRRTLGREIRGKFDSDDFVQAVWASFFGNIDQFDGVSKPPHLIGLLTAMARNKVVDEMRRRLDTQKYSVQKEQPLWELHDSKTLKSREPSPSQMAIVRERWVRLLQNQPERHRQVVRLRLMGKTQRSIAQHLGLSEKTVQRVLDQLTKVRHQ